MSRYSKACIAAALVASVLGYAAQVQAQSGVKTGTLVCDVAGGFGYIVGSRKAVNCTFNGERGYYEHYTGHITKIGLDLGETSGGTIIWQVFEPTTHHATLGGEYGGVTAQATLGAGLGANALIGGSNNAVALQPFSFEGQSGFNLAAGVGGLTLRRSH
jgi:hypothetical protein